MKGGDLIAEILKREGTDFLSVYPRSGLIEPCAKLGIRPILCRQERVGVSISDGYSRISSEGRIGVFACQQGSGIENAFPGLAQAYSENVPLLFLPNGQSITRTNIRPVFDAVDNFRHVTKWATKLIDVNQIPHVFRRAYHQMRTGKSGPVMIEIPPEMWDAEFTGDLDYTPIGAFRSAPDPSDVAKAAKALAEAKNPVIWAGQGVIYANATAELVKLAEKLQIPVMTTNPGKSAFPETHPLSLGGSVSSAPKPLTTYLRNADLVFAIGSSLTRTPFGPNVPPGKRIIQSTNHEDDINKDYTVDFALLGDALLTLQALNAELSDVTIKGREEVADQVVAAKKEWLEEWMPQLTSDEVPINQYRVIWDMMKVVDRDNTIVTHDSGSPREQIFPFWETTKPRTYMGWGKSTQLGHGLGLTMGAKLAEPDKLCLHVLGDSAIGMVGMDIETAARNRIPILTIVFNNGVMAAERDQMPVANDKYDAYDVTGNYYEMAKALNVSSFRVEKPADFVGTLKEAISVTESGGPALIECVTKEGYEFSKY